MRQKRKQRQDVEEEVAEILGPPLEERGELESLERSAGSLQEERPEPGSQPGTSICKNWNSSNEIHELGSGFNSKTSRKECHPANTMIFASETVSTRSS
jgi:hypothetical protein